MRYLWIDSLCIIQGDAADWVAEAGKMSDVYANSFLNIAAAAGNDSRGKLFAEKREGVRNLKTTPLIGSVAERLGLHARIGAVDKNQRRAIPDGDIVSYYDVWNTKARMDAPLVKRTNVEVFGNYLTLHAVDSRLGATRTSPGFTECLLP